MNKEETMKEIKLNDYTIEYLNRFYTPKISAYMFLKCFFAKLYLKDTKQVNRDLSEFLYDIKMQNDYADLLEDFTFKDNGIFKYSTELEDSILILQNMGLLGKKNPSFGIILIEMDENIANKAIKFLPEGMSEKFDNIIDKFIESLQR